MTIKKTIYLIRGQFFSIGGQNFSIGIKNFSDGGQNIFNKGQNIFNKGQNFSNEDQNFSNGVKIFNAAIYCECYNLHSFNLYNKIIIFCHLFLKKRVTKAKFMKILNDNLFNQRSKFFLMEVKNFLMGLK